MVKRGKIKHRKYASQIRDFSGLRWGKITPTDIDCAIDFGGRAYVIAEAKFKGAKLPYGQRLAIERFVDSWLPPLHAIGFVVEHTSSGDIDFASCVVTEYRYRRGWHPYKKSGDFRQAIDFWLEYIGLTQYTKERNNE